MTSKPGSIGCSIDGAAHSGSYSLACECGWSLLGRGRTINPGLFSPAPAIEHLAEHAHIAHEREQLAISATPRFCDWVADYAVLTAAQDVEGDALNLLVRTLWAW